MNKFLKIDAAIVIVILTAISYGMTYSFLRGQITYYRLPGMFVDLNINTMTQILFFSISGGVLLYVLFYLICYGLPFVLGKFIKFIVSLLKFIPSKSIQKLVGKMSGENLNDIEKTKVSISIDKLLHIYLIILLMAIAAFGRLGNASAAGKDEYMVIHQDKDLFVVVTSYKDSMIMAPLNLKKESITPKFKAIEMKELKDAEIIYFENGLKVEDVRNSKDLIE